MDSKICKIWDKSTGSVFTNIESSSDLNDLLSDNGLLIFANEASKLQSYYIPQLGTAPKWCPFLENITEEFEETTDNLIYDDYKFVTKKELDLLALTHLIGTNCLKAYMHGFYY
jgi:ribosome biogenesis protein ENP2